MPRSDGWKPCDALRAEDFERHALWGFDLSRESDPEAGETWEIFPIAYEGHVPIGAGVLEVRGTIESEGRG